jgi:hypothetical protein
MDLVFGQVFSIHSLALGSHCRLQGSRPIILDGRRIHRYCSLKEFTSKLHVESFPATTLYKVQGVPIFLTNMNACRRFKYLFLTLELRELGPQLGCEHRKVPSLCIRVSA